MNEQAAFAFHHYHESLNFDHAGNGVLMTGVGAPPISAAYTNGRSGVVPLQPLPFRPSADPPAVYNTNLDLHSHHQHRSTASFRGPQELRMAAFPQEDEELARLQELSNKWEPDVTVSGHAEE